MRFFPFRDPTLGKEPQDRATHCARDGAGAWQILGGGHSPVTKAVRRGVRPRRGVERGGGVWPEPCLCFESFGGN